MAYAKGAFTYKQKLEILEALEKNAMQVTKTAKELDVSRNSIYRIKNELWDSYIEQKHSIEVKEIEIKEKEHIIREEISENMKLVQEAWEEAMFTPEEIQKLSSSARINLLRILTPLAAKPTQDVEERERHVNQVITNFKSKLIKKTK